MGLGLHRENRKDVYMYFKYLIYMYHHQAIYIVPPQYNVQFVISESHTCISWMGLGLHRENRKDVYIYFKYLIYMYHHQTIYIVPPQYNVQFVISESHTCISWMGLGLHRENRKDVYIYFKYLIYMYHHQTIYIVPPQYNVQFVISEYVSPLRQVDCWVFMKWWGGS